MPTYAMMAYMAIVSAKLLAEDSVCRTTVIEEVSYTPADRRLCTQEVSELWQNAGLNPRFNETMDRVEDRLREDGVDVELIKQAASAPRLVCVICFYPDGLLQYLHPSY